ncbi:hypothetical protein DL96DRAFT_1595753 [Flagelloscypha sp. PMI_526]|nr:hypothetical protein DL96DRAFT_1595753 [Flagelloscypha sp. PMI_526]
MRGTQAPNTSFSWSSTILSGLDMPDAVTMYEKLSGQPAEAPAHELLDKLKGSPLAIKLFALMVSEGDKPMQLLSSWNEHGAKVLEIGGRHRLSSLEQSIRLSVFSPRINDTTRLVLVLIAMMPDGLSTSPPWLDGFQSALPNGTLVQPALRALRRAALLEENGDPSRWQMLPPIRQFCLQLADLASAAIPDLVQLHIEQVTKHWDYTSPASQAIILPEMANIRGLLLCGANLEPLPSCIGAASASYIYWAYWKGIDESAFLPSFLRLQIPTAQRADMYQKLGTVHQHWARLDSAEVSFDFALEVFIEAQDRLGQANTLQSIGELRVQRNQLDAAQTSFLRALELYVRVQSGSGEANTRYSIGALQLRQGRLIAAETSLTRALELYVESQSRLGEANTHKLIGDLHKCRGRLNAAEGSFTFALGLYSKIQDRLGEAMAYNSIGDIHEHRGQLDAAEASFACALELFVEVQDRCGEAYTHKSLGKLHLRRDKLSAAEASLTRALKLFIEVQDRVEEADTQLSIGELHLRRNQLDAAESTFACALEVYVETQNQWYIAECTLFQGQVHMRQQNLDGARTAFAQSLTFWNEMDELWGIAETHQALGDLYLCRNQLVEAEASLSLALNIYTTKVTSLEDEALTNRSFGELHLRRGHYEASERAFRRSLDLDIAANSRVGQGQSYRQLGGLFLKKKDLSAAESSYAKALRLFLEIEDYQATPCLLDLGKVWSLQGKIEEDDTGVVETLRAHWDVLESTLLSRDTKA